jgi:hypothetical protein
VAGGVEGENVSGGGVEVTQYTTATTFAAIPIGGRFVEVFTSCNEVATRIKPTTHRGKPANARRAGGGLVFMVEWEPVLIRRDDAS